MAMVAAPPLAPSPPPYSLHPRRNPALSSVGNIRCCSSTSSSRSSSSSSSITTQVGSPSSFEPVLPTTSSQSQSTPTSQDGSSPSSSFDASGPDRMSRSSSSYQHMNKKTFAEQLPPLPKEYLDPIQPGGRIPYRKPLLNTKLNRKRFPRVDKWGPAATAMKEAIELLRQADESEEAVSATFEGWDNSIPARDIVAIIDLEPSWQKALAFFKWMKKKGSFELNVYVYNVLLKSLRRGQQWEIASNLVEEMIQDGLKPDNVTYSTLISFAIRCQLPQESLRWYERMQEVGCSPDSVTYNTMINVYGKIGRMEEAFDLYHKLQEERMRLDNVTYATIIKLHGIQENYGAILGIYEEMRSKNIIPNVITFNSMIGALGKAGKIQQVNRLFTDMQKLGVEPSVITLSLLIRIYGRSGMVNEAFKLFNAMEKEGWTSDTMIYNSILNLCAEQGLVSAGEQIYGEMIQLGTCRPDDWTWRILVEMYALAGLMVEARNMLQQMLGAGCAADTMVYTSLIKGYSQKKDFKAVVEMFQELVVAGIVSDERLSGALLSAFVLCEEVEDSKSIFDCIEKANPRLGRVADMLVQEDFNVEVGKKEIEALLGESSEESRRPFCNMLIDLCWARNLGGRTHHILDFAISVGIYSDLQSQSTSEWFLKLRTLSFGAARTALQGWVSSLSAALQEGQELPPYLCIETGTGRRGTPYETAMSTFVRKQVEEIQAPFEETMERSDWFVSSGEAVKSWLQPQEASEYQMSSD